MDTRLPPIRKGWSSPLIPIGFLEEGKFKYFDCAPAKILRPDIRVHYGLIKATTLDEMAYIPEDFFLETYAKARLMPTRVYIAARTARPAWRGPGGRRFKGRWDPKSAEKKLFAEPRPI
jgi:hypothetical protein